MGRWEPGARGRLVAAALDLYDERGFEQTTVADIAQRAGVTERTFFRHFPDKREVLFQGSQSLQEHVVAAIAAQPPGASPIDVAGAAMEAAATLLEERRDFARKRAGVIAANPSLLERELLKLSTLGAAAAAALRERGVPDLVAGLAAEAGVTVFKIGFERWIADASPTTFTQHLREALDQLKALTAAS